MLYRFAHAGSTGALDADVAALKAASPLAHFWGRSPRSSAKAQENGNIAPFVPFLLAFGALGIVMAVLIVANVVGGAVVAGYRRIGILKSLGFTPAQVAAAYALPGRAARARRLPRSGRALGEPARDTAASPERRGLRGRHPRRPALDRRSASPHRSAALLPSPRCYPHSARDGSAPSRRSRADVRPGAAAATSHTAYSVACPSPVRSRSASQRHSLGRHAPCSRSPPYCLGATAVTFAVGLTGSLQTGRRRPLPRERATGAGRAAGRRRPASPIKGRGRV